MSLVVAWVVKIKIKIDKTFLLIYVNLTWFHFVFKGKAKLVKITNFQNQFVEIAFLAFCDFAFGFLYIVVFVILAKILSDAHFINRAEVTILILSLLLPQSRHQNTNQSGDF